jgi:hypothetical protein
VNFTIGGEAAFGTHGAGDGELTEGVNYPMLL